MIRWIKQKFCKHTYSNVNVRKKDIDEGVGYDLQEIYTLYCPKCKKEIEVTEWRCKIILETQRLDEEYEQLRRDKYNSKFRP